MTAAIVIPWRSSGDVHREANLTRVLDHLAPLDLPLILASDGREDGAPFCRSAAYNEGMRLSPADVYLFHEADMIVPLDQLDDAIAVAERTPGLVVPFDRYLYLGEEASRLALSGVDVNTLYPQSVMEGGTAVGAVGVASAETMRLVGRWDTEFSGHGYDDRAMYHAFRTAAGRCTIVEGNGVHLWHPPAFSPWERTSAAARPENYDAAEVQATMRNRNRMRRYLAAVTPEDVRALTGESVGGAE